jgi:general secretion pathway protein K
MRGSRGQRGSALLSVLWLSAALAAVAFTLSTTVRSETDRASTALDGLRAYYLATGAIHRAALELQWDATNPAANRRIPGPAINYVFPTGPVHVEIIPESSKLDVNSATLPELYRLGEALGLEPGAAEELAAAIDDWRRPAGESSRFDPYYLSLTPSFRARHASLQEIEELLLVKGVTPDLFHGTYVPPDLTPRPGLADCLSVYGARDAVDVNTAPGPVLAAVGVPPFAVDVIVQRRKVAPIISQQLFTFLQEAGVPPGRLKIGGGTIVTIRATARVSDLTRTAAALVRFNVPNTDSPIVFLRWYDTAWTN